MYKRTSNAKSKGTEYNILIMTGKCLNGKKQRFKFEYRFKIDFTLDAENVV